jgi:hypothetical protein
LISINGLQFVAKKFSATSSTASDAIVGFTDAPSFYLDPDSGVSAIMMDMYQNMGNLLALQWYLGSDAHNILLANRGCPRAEQLDIIMAEETFE